MFCGWVSGFGEEGCEDLLVGCGHLFYDSATVVSGEVIANEDACFAGLSTVDGTVPTECFYGATDGVLRWDLTVR